MNVFLMRGRGENHGIMVNSLENGNIETKILSISIMQSICQKFAELFPSFSSSRFDTLHVQFLTLSDFSPSLKALRHNYEAKFIDCPMAHFMMCVLRRLFQVSQSHTRKTESDLFPSSNAFMCRFSCFSLYFP
jgi:hypothetical protein